MDDPLSTWNHFASRSSPQQEQALQETVGTGASRLRRARGLRQCTCHSTKNGGQCTLRTEGQHRLEPFVGAGASSHVEAP